MAGGFVSSNGKGKEYPGKLKGYVLFTCILAAMGGLIFSYDIGISGGVTSMAPFLQKFFPPFGGFDFLILKIVCLVFMQRIYGFMGPIHSLGCHSSMLSLEGQMMPSFYLVLMA